MNRRQFSSLFLASASLLGLPPAFARITAPASAHQADPGWDSAERCQALVGRQFSASGPANASMELEAVIPHNGASSSAQQFFARFRTHREQPEGIYLLESGRFTKALFLQPVQGEPGVMEAAFSLRTA
jgi:hypothetical protein